MSIEVEVKLKIHDKEQLENHLKQQDFTTGRLVVETEVGDAKTARKILESIGFQPVLPVEKQRQYFHRENMTACLDSVKDLGDYLELEILTDSEENRTAALQKIEDALRQLGYSMPETTRTSYLSMLMKK